VTLSILRGENQSPIEFKLVRDIIKIKSIKSRTLEPGYYLIKITQFQEQTGTEFRQALKAASAAAGGQIKGLVIDLRYNPGGLLMPAVEVANCFIGDTVSSTLIVSTKGKSKDSNREFHATLGEKEPYYPLVILINGGSASASEIVAGALQDHKRAIVMGRRSFGKGSVQSIFSLPGNAALKLTTARYYTPSGHSIQAKGILPDIEVGNGMPVKNNTSKEMGIKEKDLDNRLAPAGTEEEEVHPSNTDPHAGLMGADALKDNQLNRALELLKSLNLVRSQGIVSSGNQASSGK
jgi:carboxyl-terminal processing protease